ncbi:hypothetical protein HU200_030790 [Digitaria exilis]|uniref:RING-type domain-containing protein n=1 Tax=Digitaria exilis TaxID=1010633 RepID=A0A835C000_9POAL|nr:hypothetical protein HU200_030790 [Digitaria exilis]
MQQILDELDRAGVRGPAPARTAGQDLHLGDGRFVPASREAMARLRETTVAAETREEEECAVCLKSFEEGDRMGAMPCSHEFHDGCIRRWLAISCLCPLCRFALQSPPRGS